MSTTCRTPGDTPSPTTMRRGDPLDEMLAAIDAPTAAAIQACAAAAIEIGERIAVHPFDHDPDDRDGLRLGTNATGDRQQLLDIVGDAVMARHLDRAGVAAIASEERRDAEFLNPSGGIAVAYDPIDGSKNVTTNAAVGMIFSIRPHPGGDDPAVAFMHDGTTQTAAGLVLYGPATVMALTIGEGTHLFALDPATGRFIAADTDLAIPHGTTEYAINASNRRHWTPEVRQYVNDLVAGASGPRERNFNTRWLGALVGEVIRILRQGGIYLYPADRRATHRQGSLRLVYEAHPVAMLVEQAGGTATDGRQPILACAPSTLHARTPLVFGSPDKVERFGRYTGDSFGNAETAPLFAGRGLFRNDHTGTAP
ncbi:MAG: class 1 fructose-bisphosphatase [Actinomycetota bacterium]